MCLFREHRMAIVLQAMRAKSWSPKGYVIVGMNFVVIPLVADDMSVV